MRIVQGKEPPHFMLIFKGTLIIRQGGVKSSFTHVKKVGVCFFAGDRFRFYHLGVKLGKAFIFFSVLRSLNICMNSGFFFDTYQCKVLLLCALGLVYR